MDSNRAADCATLLHETTMVSPYAYRSSHYIKLNILSKLFNSSELQLLRPEVCWILNSSYLCMEVANSSLLYHNQLRIVTFTWYFTQLKITNYYCALSSNRQIY